MTVTSDTTSEALIHRNPLRVAIVDDAPSTRRLLRAILASVPSYEVVDEVGTGEEAVGMVAQVRPDVVLLDLSLPDMDGSEVLSEILKRAPDTKVIILSNTSRRAAPMMVGAGATGFIEKGLPPLDLLDRLSQLLQIPTDQPAESVTEFLGSTRTFAPTAVAFDANPSTLRQLGLVLAECGIKIVAEVVSQTDVASSLQSAIYMTRPAVVILGEGGPTGDLLTCIEEQSPRVPVIAYVSEPPRVSLHNSNARVVIRPNYELLERTIWEVVAPSASR